MSSIEIRTTIKLTLDNDIEGDLVSEIEEMTSHRKFGEYIAKLIRFAYDNKDKMESIGFSSYEKDLSSIRKEHTSSLLSRVNTMMARVELYSNALMAMEAFLTASRSLGISVSGSGNIDTDEKVKDLLAVQLDLQRKLNELRKDCVGLITDCNSQFEISTEQVAEKAFDLIITRYENELTAYSLKCSEAERRLNDLIGIANVQRAMLLNGIPLQQINAIQQGGTAQPTTAMEYPEKHTENVVKRSENIRSDVSTVGQETDRSAGRVRQNNGAVTREDGFSYDDMDALEGMFS